MSTFVEYATKVLSPPRLRGPWGERWVTAFASEHDWMLAWLMTCMRARYPGSCPSDGLDFIGLDRQIRRVHSESSSSYAARLWSAWETWELSGTGPGILAGVDVCGIPSPVWGRGPAWPTVWPDDGYVWLVPERCFHHNLFPLPEDSAKFYVVINWWAFTNGDTAAVRGDPDFVRGDWGVRGLNIEIGMLEALKQSVRKWKAAGETCECMVFCMTENGVADLRLPLWRRGMDDAVGGGSVVYIPVEEEGYRG